MEMLNKSDDTEMIMQATFMLAKQRHLEFVTPELTLASLTTLEEVEHLFHVLNQDLKAFRKELLGSRRNIQRPLRNHLVRTSLFVRRRIP